MPAGFQVFGSHGVIQVDQEYKNFLLRAKGSVYVGANQKVDISFGSMLYPVLAIEAAGGYVGVSCLGFNNNTVTYQLLAEQNVGATVTYYVFDAGGYWQDTSPGLSVYGPDGALVYNSSQHVMKIASEFRLPEFQGGEAEFPRGGIGYPYVGRFAATFTSGKVMIEDSGGQNGLLKIDGVRTDQGFLAYGPAFVGAIPTDIGYQNGRGARGFLIDVGAIP